MNEGKGARRSFGDAGPSDGNPTARSISVRSAGYFLPGRRPDTGRAVFLAFRTPLAVSVRAVRPCAAYLPLVGR